MARILVTGMSGTGKSSALAELGRRGYAVVDTDDDGWCELDPAGEPLWDAGRMDALLAEPRHGSLFVSGCVANQGAFYDRFDAVVLLSAPLDVLIERVATRTTNDFGKSDAERAKIASDVAEFEPLIRAGVTHEIDTRKPLGEVVDELEAVAARAA